MKKQFGAALGILIVFAWSGLAGGKEMHTCALLTSDEVVERLLAQPALRRHATTCVLPAVRVGSEWLFRKSDLERWIADRVAK